MAAPTFDSVNKIWSGPKVTPTFNVDANLGLLMLDGIKTTPNRILQVCDDTKAEMNCLEMHERATKFAKYFSDIGLKQDDVVGFICGNSENVVPVIIACLALGLPINPLAPAMNKSDITYMFNKTKPKVIFCDFELVEKVQESVDEMKIACKIITFREKTENYLFASDLITNFNTTLDFEWVQRTFIVCY